MNAANGSAIFGKRDISNNKGGQIIIDPNGERALLYSSNYYDNYKEDGLPSSYSKPSETYKKDGQTYYHQGMLIDLTTPQIRFRSGKFEVDSEGHLTAKGGGSIAGWQIGDDKLSSNDEDIYLDSSATEEEIMFKVGDNFEVQANGALYAGKGYFVGEIESSSIKSSTISNGDGTFYVTSDGILTAKSGTIGGWTIDSTKLYCGETKLEVYGTYTEGEEDKRYGILTVPFIELNKTNVSVSSVGTQSGVIGWYKGNNGTTETDVIGIGTYDNSIVLESDKANIRLSVPTGKKIYLDAHGDEEGLKFNNHYIYARFK